MLARGGCRSYLGMGEVRREVLPNPSTLPSHEYETPRFSGTEERQALSLSSSSPRRGTGHSSICQSAEKLPRGRPISPTPDILDSSSAP